MKEEKVINVSKPFMPPRKLYHDYLAEIWKNEWITNNGPLLKRFEQNLCDTLMLDDLVITANGTLGLQLAIKALGLEYGDEVITTPFSYIATTSSSVWEGLTPVFIDIDKDTFNINAGLIEKVLSNKTKAIIATHVFGNPCDITAIEEIAAKHNLKVIYDAAHCFGVRYNGESILRKGDISVLSLHATKLFHCVEGGGIACRDKELLSKVKFHRNFGHDGYYKFNGVGINAKNSELHAAMGLANLHFLKDILEVRKRQWLFYHSELEGSNLKFQRIHEYCDYNYAYFPVVFKSESELLKKTSTLEKQNIYCRRYFYPPLHFLEYVKSNEMPVCESISSRILCLPLYHDLSKAEQDRVIKVLKTDGIR